MERSVPSGRAILEQNSGVRWKGRMERPKGSHTGVLHSLLLICSGSLAYGSWSLRIFPNTSLQAAMTNQMHSNGRNLFRSPVPQDQGSF